MNVSAESYGHAVILNCKGELTLDSLDAFKTAVERQLQEDQVRDVVLNLREVPFVDSAALEYLLDLQERINDRLGQVRLVGLDENLAKIFEITRLDGVFDRYDDAAEAVKTLGG